MAVVSGPRGSNSVTQDIRKVDFGDAILLLQPDAAPLTVLTKRLGKSVTHNPDFKWAEDDLDVRFDAINNGAGYTDSATSIVVDTGTLFAQHDLVKNTRTGEVFRVTAVATNTLTVVRGVGNSGTGVAMLDNDELLILGSAQPEGDTSKAARSSTTTTQTGYTQIFRRPVELTETWRHSDQNVSENDWDYQIKKAGIEHMKDIELAFLYGKASLDTSGPQPRRTTGGVISGITTNVTAAGGALSEASFWAALRPAFRYGAKRKTMFASPLVVSVLNGYARGKVQVINQSANTYGVNVTQYQSPQGLLNVVSHDLLEGAYGGYGVIVDMENAKYRFLSNSKGKGSRDTHLNTNIQAPDADTRKDEFLTECGLALGQQKTHALITGVTG